MKGGWEMAKYEVSRPDGMVSARWTYEADGFDLKFSGALAFYRLGKEIHGHREQIYIEALAPDEWKTVKEVED